MQVDPTLMNVGDGGTVSREISAPNKASTSMVGNPPQTLPPEFRGDVTLSQQNKTTPTTDCKTVKACPDTSNYNHSPELSPPQQPNNAPMSGSALTSSEKRAEKRAEAPKLKADGAGVFPTPQWSSGVKVNREESLNPCHSNVTSSKKSHTQTQSVQSAPPGFQCSTMFKPAQPVAFLPSTNFSSPLCKITLPPALGQIAALREATANQFQKEIQPQSSGVGGTPLMRTYPYPFSVGRTPAAEKKASTSKLKSNHSSSKNTKSAGEHKSLASVVASPAIALPLQHPSLPSAAPTHYTLSPTAAICCGSALASITSQSRLLNHVEKGNSLDKTTMGSLKTTPPSASEDHTVACSIEPRDVPLDLSAKSKRPKCINDPPVSMMETHNNESNQRDFLNSKRTHSTSYSSAVQYPILPNTHRNGSHQKQLNRPQNHQVPEPKPSWGKGSSQDPIKNIPGTYVGVASPILASTLRGKDGKGTFADEFQSFAKQEFISIIDQGEHLASGGKKPSCLMKGNQHAHSVKHVKNTSTAIIKNSPIKGALTTALSSSANAQIHQKSGTGKSAVPYSTTAVSPAWQQPSHLPHQASSVQRKLSQGSLKTKTAAAEEGSKFQSAHQSPSNTEDDKWERMSPLSNLASIVKQQALETTALTGKGNNQAPPVASRKADVLNLLTGSQDAQSKHSSAFEYPPYWSVEKWPGVPSQGDSTQAIKRLEKANATEPLENNTEIHTSQGEHMGLQAKQSSSKPAGQSHIFGSNASTNGNRMESKLAQVLEGEILKKESGASESPPSEKLEGIVASILTGQCTGGGDKFEKKTNGTKEESPTKAKAAAIKQKKTSPKKPVKEKSPTDPSKKAAGKKKQDTESTPTKVSCQKKQKKRCAPVLEKSLSAGKLSPQSKEQTPRDKISPKKVEQSTRNKPVADSGSSPQSVETPVSLNSSVISSKETDATDSSFPRLRRGRRRADEARLDLWGFATPSPPPPQIPPPPPSPSPPPTATQPARRPRGRPRSNPLPERVFQGKGKTASAEGDTPAHKKRRRCRSKKYQTGEYITEKDKLEDGEHLEESDTLRQDRGTASDSQTDQCPSPTASSPEPPPRRPSFTRSGSVRYQESEVSPESNDKPSGKRKFKSKHLCDSDEQKIKTKRSSLGKRGASLALDDDGADVKRTESPLTTAKSLPSSPSNKKNSSGRSSGSESPPKRPVPPEVRRLIVNKNAGETLLQRAARLGYQDVVQYCLEKDIREVNRRDNAGYTALHEASSRGWTQIVQMLLKHGADVNCSAQDGTRPLHDAVASDNLPIVWLLLNHGADPTLATYSGHTPVKLAHSPSMKTFLTEYFTDLEGRSEQDPTLPWDFYSSSLFETDQEPCWDFLLSEQNQELEEITTANTERDSDKDCLLFEFSSEPLLPCYHVQVSLTQGFCNWFLLTDVLKRLKMSSRIFRARYPHLEVVSLSHTELCRQVSVSQVSSALAPPYKGKNKEDDEKEEEEEGLVELVRCVPELQRLLGSSIHILQEDEEEEEEEEEGETLTNIGKPRSR
ncbi:BCL-6 corepressor-like protein 1 isoform X1 [Thunnus maccoyii]|uniref:BCL-6 corepressor-like protein 1 isoform X1 n=1 Tax=Thunnus maccoyii TaxID=8240 RepID=UPI001C4DB851|nr:BCL-6 corepressor-like protein 1 isoform X1 [Thunnus maccoyii]XP_042274031.1 BCL-6 corepressor-like protein 1 isoform X1 [Thunnus maccoyii]XP_042274033.1 BCL-6 corepressor-like protein 1 isoform X1 [Thunnus maccoyii]XP_042274034.1 BCL-6 corepressor-like protein 1 isoform X1 [Thunnus maccoyii]XP_042274035.1 BCL-6 corepressor-like protein 1 isoform X1 [Thunnus maccoyii]XP_042274036.1 BCL-6 corepressor-like protein 1 isoform X1 [Thunnus maccoyii]XP_042274037.1 BCL-6 corepressor-like protein 1